MDKGGEYYRKRDHAIENHICVYGLSLYAVISELFLGGRGKAAGTIAAALRKKGRVEIHQRLAGKANLVTPTAAACRDCGVTARRAGLPKGSAAIDAMIQRLIYCCASESRRFLLTPRDVESLLGATFQPNVFHVATEEFETPKILRVYSALTTKSKNTIQSLQNNADDAMSKCRSAARSFDYGVVVLAATEAAATNISTLIRRKQLPKRLFIDVKVAPDSQRVTSYLRKRKQKDD